MPNDTATVFQRQRKIKYSANTTVYCTCALMFTRNSKGSFPLHTLVADATETCEDL